MDFSYEVRRSSRRKRLTIVVERNRNVVVLAPENTTEEQIEQILTDKRQWIHEKIGHPQKYQTLPHPPGKELVNGESAFFMGKQYQVEIVKSGLNEVKFDHRFLIPASFAEQKKEALREWYFLKAKEIIPSQAEKIARYMGLEIKEVRIADNRYTWGSCSSKNNISFNWRLIKAPRFVIDYVITHELAHLIEPNHTPKFWSIVKAQNPTTEKAKAWLKDNGQMLEDII